MICILNAIRLRFRLVSPALDADFRGRKIGDIFLARALEWQNS